MGRREENPDFALPGTRGAAAALVLSAALISAVQARAQGADCDGLAADIRDGLDYSVSIDVTDQTVNIQTDKGDCREPVATWAARKLPLSSSPAPLEKGTPKISLPLGDDGLIAAPPDESLAPPPMIPEGALGSPSIEDSLAPPSMIPRGMLKRPPTKEEAEATAAAAEAIMAAREAKATADAAAAAEDASPAAAEVAAAAAEALAAAVEAISAAQATTEAARGDNTAGAAAAAAAAVAAAEAAKAAAAKATAVKAAAVKAAAAAADAPGAERAGVEAPESEAAAGGEPAAETKNCTKDLGDFWQAGEHDIRGTMFWLAGVSTMDTDNDGQVDNVVFKIKSKGHVDNVIRYFGTGRLSGQAIPTLRLKDDRDVTRLCPGALAFANPKDKKPEAPPPPKKTKKVDAPVELGKLTISASTLRENKHWFAIFGVIFLAAGGYGFFRTLKTLDQEKKKQAAIRAVKAAPA